MLEGEEGRSRAGLAINNPMERKQEKKQQTETNKSREMCSATGTHCEQLLVLHVIP